jgi:hypothetical protein
MSDAAAWCRRAFGIGGGLVLLTLTAGCPPPARLELRDARQALDHVNSNLEKAEGGLYGKPATVSFRFRDAEGHDRRFIGHPATLIFQPPRCLYLDIKHSLGGSVARIGSNDQRYWIWVDTPELRKLWWGYWDEVDASAGEGLPIPPSLLLDALMMRPLAERVPGGLPALLIDENPYRLLFQRFDRHGWPYLAREIVLDQRPPYQPVEIIDRLPDGRVLMHATLKGYRPVEKTGQSGPHTARRWVVHWPLDDTEMRLDLDRVRYRTKDTPFCEFPEHWNGEIEQIGALPSAEFSPPAQERTP